MHKHTRHVLLCFSVFLSLSFISGCNEGPVKPPSVAGSFYPAEPEKLRNSVRQMLNKARPVETSGKLITLISPHAGYKYSGQVAAAGYRQLEGKRYKTVVIIGSSHKEAYKGAAIITKGSMATPLGNIRIDEKAASELLSEGANIREYSKAFDKEHSLEVQLPFLQETLRPGFKILPILLGITDQRTYDHLTAGLSALAARDDVLIIASTDLSHYHDYDSAVAMDAKLINAFRRLSVRQSIILTSNKEAEMCGANAVFVALEVSRRLGANLTEVFSVANSGDVTGDRSRVVGYLSAGIYNDPFNDEAKNDLLRLARDTVTSYVMTGKLPDEDSDDPRLKADGAVFITINKNGKLRGCIGDVQPYRSLKDSVMSNAVRASSKDLRFPPVRPSELDELEIEVSILSHLTPVNSVNEIVVGTHGLLISKGSRSGLLLPQVPVQQGWGRDTFLNNLSIKAGLPKGAWREGATIYRFTAEVFKE